MYTQNKKQILYTKLLTKRFYICDNYIYFYKISIKKFLPASKMAFIEFQFRLNDENITLEEVDNDSEHLFKLTGK